MQFGEENFQWDSWKIQFQLIFSKVSKSPQITKAKPLIVQIIQT